MSLSNPSLKLYLDDCSETVTGTGGDGGGASCQDIHGSLKADHTKNSVIIFLQVGMKPNIVEIMLSVWQTQKVKHSLQARGLQAPFSQQLSVHVRSGGR